MNRTLSRMAAAGAVVFSLGLGACSDDPELSIFETLEGDARFTTLVTAVELAGLDDELTTGGPFTLFAPTNAAFAALPDGVLDAVLADPDLLEAVLLYHVASGMTLSTDLSDGQSIETLLGQLLFVTISGSTVEINDATVTQADLDASNGVIHVIDGVLVPEAASLSAIVAEIERRRERTPGLGSTTKLGLGDDAQNGLN